MDRVIEKYPVTGRDDALTYCVEHGVAYQTSMQVIEKYDDAYFAKLASYENTPVGDAIHAGRARFVARHVLARRLVCDVGAGSCEFVRTRPNTHGTDVCEKTVRWLVEHKLYAENLEDYKNFCFWDVLEHVPCPASYFDCMAVGSHVFTSVPVISDIRAIRNWKHYRPGEHLYYFTVNGFVNWMRGYGFEVLESSLFETLAGRQDIASFAFIREKLCG